MSTFPLPVRIYLKSAFLDRVKFEIISSDTRTSENSDRTRRNIENLQNEIDIQWKVQAAFDRAIGFYERFLEGLEYQEEDFDIGYGKDFAEELVKGISTTGPEIIPDWTVRIIDPKTERTSCIARVSEEVALEYLKEFIDEAFEILSSNTLFVPAQFTKGRQK